MVNMQRRRFQGTLTIKEEESVMRLLKSCGGFVLFVMATWLLAL